MNIISYTIETGLIAYKGNIMTVPFSVVMQTQSQKIEKYCITTWPILMTHQQYSPEDNLLKYKMYAYIKNNLSTSDLNDIHKIAYDRNWMTPFELNDNGSKCELKEYGCKIRSNPNIPYLELKGILSIDLIQMFNIYIKKGWITFESKSGMLSENPYIKIGKNLPYIIKYGGSQTPYDIILNEIIKQSKQKDSAINKLIVTKTKLKNIHDYEKKITWGLEKNIVNIELKEKMRLLKDKALENPIKYGLLGLATHELTKDWKASSKVTAAAATYLYMKGK